MGRNPTLQKRVIKRLEKKPVGNVAKMAIGLGVLRSSVSRILHRLKSQGVVKKEGGWRLTDKGAEIASRITLSDEDITSKVSIGGYDEEMVTLTKCICGQTFPTWEFIIDIYREWAKECPNCKRKLYCSFGIKVYEVED